MNLPALALGTVQWGMSYGIANQTGQASEADVAAMLAMAADAGVDTLDTARAYGDAEAVIGRVLADKGGWRVVTKIDPGIGDHASDAQELADATVRSLELSRSLLGCERLDAVLLHRPEHRVSCGGAAWATLCSAQRGGEIGVVGVSATSPETALDALDVPDLQLMQVATSLLDRRLVVQGFFSAAQDRGVEVHVRSAFLQGVAFMAPGNLPPHLNGLGPSLALIDAWAAERGTTRATAFLAYVLSLPVARVVLGCEHPDQLRTNLASLDEARALASDASALASSLPELPAAMLDPSQWVLAT